MRDPYQVLGVPSTATDDEVKKAYRDLARKYHPDNYHDNPLADLAQERMKEINEAYEEVQSQRKAARQGGYTGGSYGGYGGSYGGAGYGNAGYGAGYGTENDAWYQATSELEPDAMVAELRTQGMAGIYLDLDGYTEDEQQPTLAALIQAAGCAEDDVIISESG